MGPAQQAFGVGFGPLQNTPVAARPYGPSGRGTGLGGLLRINGEKQLGVGKTLIATALGHVACRRRVKVHFERADRLFRRLKAARLDASYEAEARKLVGTDLLIIDDFARQRLDPTETADFYELVVERHKAAPTLLTSNREPRR